MLQEVLDFAGGIKVIQLPGHQGEITSCKPLPYKRKRLASGSGKVLIMRMIITIIRELEGANRHGR